MADYSMGGAPRQQSVFRDHTFRFDRAELPVLDPGATHPLAAEIGSNPRCGKPVVIRLDDLDGAQSAELLFEYWGGHLGTSNQGFCLNGGEWRPLPQPLGTPTTPVAYYRVMLGGATVPVDLSELRSGDNELLFTAGPQVVHNFDLGFYWLYSCTLRVYYAADKPHPLVELIWPAPDETVAEMPVLAAKCREGFTQIRQVDFVAHCEDFPWSGNGMFRQWHVQSHWGQWKRHAGVTDHTVTDEPLSCTWDTEWLPDQPERVSLMARVLARDGVSATTPVTPGIRFTREWRSVRMFRSGDVPEAFGARMKERRSCTIPIDTLRRARSARLLLSTWSAAHGDRIGLNGTVLYPRIGRVHDHSFDLLPVPLSLLHEGPNECFVYAKTEHHAIEVNWPGPVLLVEYA